MYFIKICITYTFVIFILLCKCDVYCSESSSNQNTLNDFDSIIIHIQEKVGCDERYAILLYQIINYFAEGIQTDLTYIAQSTDDLEYKEKRIKNTISRYFQSPESNVQVSSLSRSSIFDFSIHTYLHRLAKLRSRYRYTKVELIFEPDYLGISRFEKVGDSKYELSVSMWQKFVGYIGDSVVYSDATRKKFRLYFVLNEKPTVKIDEILVAETVNLDYYKRHRK
ncbi:hypothetical protein MHK_005613 [Candidatus Magnetomorum sp. HK-1]|nr:hypothetical protein MHK_005613 [Candidatus Magnetomorum sp. HK-1]